LLLSKPSEAYRELSRMPLTTSRYNPAICTPDSSPPVDIRALYSGVHHQSHAFVKTGFGFPKREKRRAREIQRGESQPAQYGFRWFYLPKLILETTSGLSQTFPTGHHCREAKKRLTISANGDETISIEPRRLTAGSLNLGPVAYVGAVKVQMPGRLHRSRTSGRGRWGTVCNDGPRCLLRPMNRGCSAEACRLAEFPAVLVRRGGCPTWRAKEPRWPVGEVARLWAIMFDDVDGEHPRFESSPVTLEKPAPGCRKRDLRRSVGFAAPDMLNM